MWRVLDEYDWLVIIDELELIEEWFSVEGTLLDERYNASLESLTNDDPGVWFRDVDNIPYEQSPLPAFGQHWDAGAIGGVPVDNVALLFRDGFRSAIHAARARNAKLSVVAVRGDNGSEGFGVGHIVGRNAVTVVIRIPADAMPPEPQTS
jgi:hypothetical protein